MGVVYARSLLSTLELQVAGLYRQGVGRNGIAASLGISVNTVKTVLRRLRHKLGEDWSTSPAIIWPEMEGLPGPPDLEILERIEAEEKEVRLRFHNRGLATTLLILQSRPERSVLRVTGGQRFWLKPALAYLEREKHLHLVGVDHHDVFAPPWLPVVNRGRRLVRGAYYVTRNPRLISSYLEHYLTSELEEHLLELGQRLEKSRAIAGERENSLPGLEEIKDLAYQELGWPS